MEFFWGCFHRIFYFRVTNVSKRQKLPVVRMHGCVFCNAETHERVSSYLLCTLSIRLALAYVKISFFKRFYVFCNYVV